MSSDLAPLMSTRRRFLRRLGFGFVGFSGIGYGYGSYEVSQLTVERTTLTPRGLRLTRPCTLVQLTDLHLDPAFDFEWLEKVVAAANALAPDVIALTGDFITHEESAMADIAPVLGKLKAPGGVFACLGNHDQWNGSISSHQQTLDAYGVRVLNNEAICVTLPQGELQIAGTQSAWSGAPNPARALSKVPAGTRALLLAHEPDIALSMDVHSPVALQLSGHTHGGQICLPGGYAMRLPKLGKHFVRGLYPDKAPWPVYVSRGVGTIGPHLRVASRPEITCLTLQPE